MNNTKKWLKDLIKLDPCPEAVEWAKSYESPDDAWAKCKRGDWMLWVAGRLSEDANSASRKKLVLAACKCARLALPYVRPGETRPRAAIDLTERWANGDQSVTLEMIRGAAGDAWAAGDAARAAWDAARAAWDAAMAAWDAPAAMAAWDAAWAAGDARAAWDAGAATWAAWDAAWAAGDAWAAMAARDATWAAWDAARDAALSQCADIVREFYPSPPQKARPPQAGEESET